MTTPLVVAATVLSLLVTALGTASTVARRRIGLVHLVGAGLLEAVLLVQAVVAVAGYAGGTRPPEAATFFAYLASVVLLPVAGWLWARTEPTRWAGTVLGVATLTVAVMVWRLDQLWEAAGA